MFVEAIKDQINYDPFKEDVYSLGLIGLQMMLMCGQREIEEIVQNKNQLT